ncbi:uncharacterized protein LOC110018283 [Phalaenopsis equestris]|uniref:uncharacterized protein LOC110018283 n=1 Tax=Phalaenopsis equestris TaxID=78828 RepID=UPI0009E40DD8|nr:uncharacterized protein LOC110018283 [Phalaenopsis equestris]
MHKLSKIPYMCKNKSLDASKQPTIKTRPPVNIGVSPYLSFLSYLSPPPAMAMEVAGTCLNWSSPLPYRGPLSAKTVAHAISFLLHNSTNSHDLAKTHNTVHCTPFLGTTLIHHSHQREISRGGRRTSSSASLDENEEEFESRINELNLKFKINVESQLNQEAETSTCGGESAPTKIESMPPESWPGSDGLVLQKTEWMAKSFDLPLSLRILKRKKDELRQSAQMKESASCSVKKAFSSTVLIVRELHSHLICMREALFSPDNFQIQETLARVHDDLHSSFVWLFHRIFSTTPTLMVYLMLLLANFTVFSITDHHIAAAPQSVIVSIEESQNPSSRFSPPTIKTFSLCSSSAVGGSGGGGGKRESGGGGGKPPAIASAADDGHSDRSSASLGEGGAISPEVISMATLDEKKVATEWKKMVRETKEMLRANGRHEALMDPDTLRRFVSSPDDLSVYCGTELSYRIALAENPDNALLLSNYAQFLYTVHRDHERAEEYFRRAVRAEPAEAETLSRYASFLWLARKDLEAAEETFLEAISADPGNSHHSANYAHFLWSTGGEDTCYPLSDCDA